MRMVRFVQVGTGNTALICNVTVILNKIQDAYKFDFDEQSVAPRAKSPVSSSVYPSAYIEELVAKHMRTKKYSEYPIAVTALPLDEELISSSDDQKGLISTHDWAEYSKYPLHKGLCYLVAAILLDIHLLTGAHYDAPRSCPNDFCDDRKEIDLGLAKCEFCDECKESIRKGVERGAVSLQEVVAINRIFDYVADRRVCFVLMPFRDSFDEPYATIKSVASSAGFMCTRADEIFETRTAMDIVYERIARAELIIADLTDRNPNVFYELGYAHAMNKPAILIAQREEDVPFDVRHKKYVQYDRANLPETLAKRLSDYLPRR